MGQLVKRLQSHCSFVRVPSSLCLASLLISSLAGGVNIWHVGSSSQAPKLNMYIIATLCTDFVAMGGLLVFVLWKLASVQKEIQRCFIKEIKEHLTRSSESS